MKNSSSVLITRFPYTSQLGGEEIHTFMIAEHLRKSGFEVEFLTSCPVLRHYANQNKFKVKKLWLFKPPVTASTYAFFTFLYPILSIWSLLILIFYKLTRKNLQIYSLSFTEKLLFAPWTWLLRIPTIWVEHARIGNWFHKNAWKFWYKLWAKDNKFLRIITVSEVMKKDLNIDSVEVIPNAIDAKEFSRLQDAGILPLEVKNFIKESKFTIGYVGRLTEDKGMELLFDLKKTAPELGIITIGSGGYKTRLEKIGIRNFPYMKKKEVAAFMQNIDLLVLPATRTDPFGLIVLEAIAAKCPTIITTKVGAKDYLRKTETIVCEPKKFVETVLNFVKSPKSLTTEKTMERFKLDKMLASYLGLFLR